MAMYDDDDEHDALVKALAGTGNKGADTLAGPAGIPYAAADWSAPQQQQVAAAPAQQPQAVAMPVVPTMPTRDADMYESLMSNKARDSQVTDSRNPALKVGWKDRLRGGLVAGLASLGGARDAIDRGSAVTNSKYNGAEQARQGHLQADDVAVKDWNDQRTMDGQDYERSLQGYGAEMQGFKAKQDQSNADRTFSSSQDERTYQHGRDTTGDERNARLDKQKADDDTFNHQHITSQDAETKRYHDVESGLGYARLNSEERRANKTEKKEDTLRREQAVNKTDADRQAEYDFLENGDSKNQGFREKFDTLKASKLNPATGKKWQPGELNTELDHLTEQHNAAKNRVEQKYAQARNTLHVPTQPVRYGNDNQPQPGAPASVPAVTPSTQTKITPVAQPQQQKPHVALAPKPGQKIDRDTAMRYVQLAGRDPRKAEQLAQQDGWSF